jgi:thiosulfate dehydrogenase [quinone] large subunit
MRELRVWPAFLRVVIGAIWLFEAYPQLATRETFLGQGFGRTVQSMASGNPWTFYREFLLGFVLPHAPVFSYLTLVANAVVGLCLLLGLLTPYGAAVGIVLNINYALAAGWMDHTTYSLNALLITCEIIIIAQAAGKVAGFDAVLSGGAPKRPRRY